MDVKEIEKEIVALRMRERELVETRNRVRAGALYNAEKLPVINRIIDDVFVGALGFDRHDVEKYSMQGKCEGTDNEEYLSEAVLILTAGGRGLRDLPGCSELSMKVRIHSGFEDEGIRLREHEIMEELTRLRGRISELGVMKKKLKKSANSN